LSREKVGRHGLMIAYIAIQMAGHSEAMPTGNPGGIGKNPQVDGRARGAASRSRKKIFKSRKIRMNPLGVKMLIGMKKDRIWELKARIDLKYEKNVKAEKTQSLIHVETISGFVLDVPIVVAAPAISLTLRNPSGGGNRRDDGMNSNQESSGNPSWGRTKIGRNNPRKDRGTNPTMPEEPPSKQKRKLPGEASCFSTGRKTS